MTWAVLPNHPMDPRVIEYLMGAAGPAQLSYESGRPWILSDTHPSLVLKNRHVHIVATGHPAETEDKVRRRLDGIARLEETRDLAESAVEFDTTLFVREGDRTRVYAPLFGSRSAFWTRVLGATVVADEQRILAVLSGLRLHLGVLSSRITNAEVSHPFMSRSIWEGVETLGVGECITVGADGAVRRERWWTPPPADRPLAELGGELAAALSESLRLRVSHRTHVGADLSGGLDSTTLCFALAEQDVDLHTFFITVGSDQNNDQAWSRRASAEICSQHREISYREVLKGILADAPASWDMFPEGPTPMASVIASAHVLRKVYADTEVSIHLNGHAGDALFGQVSTLPWSYFHSKGRGRWSWLRQYFLLNRTPAREVARMLIEHRSFDDELRDMANAKFPRTRLNDGDHARWIQAPSFNRAHTNGAVERVVELARAELQSRVEPLSLDKTQHQVLSYLGVHGAVMRRTNIASGTVLFDSPYLDRRVVEAAISLNHRERTRQDPVKPLLANSRPKAMSLEYFLRVDKGDYSAETFEHYDAIFSNIRGIFFEGSRLAELGLIDAGEVIRMSETFSADGSSVSDIIDLEFAERWLRSIDDSRFRLSQWST